MKQMFGILYCLFIAMYLTGCTAGALNRNHPSGSAADPPAAVKAQISDDPISKEKILQTLQKAVESGHTEVNIYLDENPALIQPGDLVKIHVTAATEDGQLINTTVAEVANQENQKWLPGHKKVDQYHPIEVIAGAKDEFPGVNDAVLGMRKNQKKITTVPAEKAFGPADPEKIKEYPSVRKVPKQVAVQPLDFVKQYNMFPIVGKQFDFNPYLNARILDVSEQKAVLGLSAKPENEMLKVSYGTTRVTLEDDTFVIELTPEIGGLFEMGDKKGRITRMDDDTFTVDFNHPMAGKSMVLEVEVLEYTKASVVQNHQITWIEDYYQAEEQSKKQNKPMVLLLYASWCQWSQKMIRDVLDDPRITKLHDRFVWVKIDSDKHREYKEGFDQKSYPKLLIIDPQGAIVDSMDGYNNVHVVSKHLSEVHAGKMAG